MNHILITKKSLCTGCSACLNICPQGCITMETDQEGFLYPSVNTKFCINCGLCKKHCPIDKPFKNNDCNLPKVYAAWSKNPSTRDESTSGGIFSELASAVLQMNGYIAGAKYAENHMVEHTLIHSEEDLPLLRQSKYVQSSIQFLYQKIQSLLKQDLPVLFVGTPCQCAGLNSYLGKTYNNLYLCDFICRGVNSPFIYQKYLSELSQKFNSEVTRVWFKNKKNGWNQFGTKIDFKNGSEYFESRDNDDFMYGYIKKGLNLYMRPSCEECKFKGTSRITDITLGDFWGIKLHNSSESVEQGVSLVMLRSQKALNLWASIIPNIYLEEHTLGEVFPHNDCLINSAKASAYRNDFWEKIQSSTFHNIIQDFKSK